MKKNALQIFFLGSIPQKVIGFFIIRPPKGFYEQTGINQKRFGQLIRGDKSPTEDEIKSIAEFLNVDVNEIIKLINQ